MGPEIGVIELVHWVAYLFPSLSEYTKILIPTLVFVVSVIGVFSNILPEPGDSYPVPRLVDLETELQGRFRIIYRLAVIARSVTICVNKVVCSKTYSCFYKTTKFCSHFLDRLKGKGTKSSDMKISKPEPYTIRFKEKDKDR